ncbi:leucine-rich repeat extensin-like protein 5 isoform X2 [Trichosurus vulpecula]|uniref:leucine-rich repeat extensin-like protein 5 isoform X2 n=1 Tax=Trichosurus vulpecula TaxID=9337 RepID=UPI00186B3148|nr:leucine-rich repeat extensin-like protein 5 isoform X2 [Trichosurus vulpecula]
MAHPRGELWYPMPFQLLCQAVPPVLGSSRSRPTFSSRSSLSLCKGPPLSLISGTPYSRAHSTLQCRVLLLPAASALPSSTGPRLLHLQNGPSPSLQGGPSSVSVVLSSLRPQTCLLKNPLPSSPKPSRYRVLGCPQPQSCSLKEAPLSCAPSPSHSPQTRSHLLNGEPALGGSPTTSLCSVFSSLRPQGHPLKGRPLPSRASPSYSRTVPGSPLIKPHPLLKGSLPARASPAPCRTVSPSSWLKAHPLKGKPIAFSPNSSRGKTPSSLRPRSHLPKGAPGPSSPKPSHSLQPKSPPLKACSVFSHCQLPCSAKVQSPLLLGAPLPSDPSLSCRGLLHSLQLSPSRHRGLAFPMDVVLASPELLFSPLAQDFREKELGISFLALPRLSSQGIPPNSPTSGFSPTPTPCSLYPGLGSPGSQDGHTPTLCPRMIQSVPLSGVSRELGEPRAFSGGDAGQGWDLEKVALQPQYEGRHLSGSVS